jgi:PAS domain S-box-containing protein
MSGENARFASPLDPNAFLAAIIESSDDAIITKDLNGIVTSWNRAAEHIFGYGAQEMIGKPVALLIPPDRADEEPAILARLRRGEKIDHYQTIRRRKDGSLVPISLTVSPVKDESGRLIGASKVARDISIERQASEGMRQSEERYRITLGCIGDAVIATDLSGRITFMNPVAEQLTGWSQKDSLRQPLEKVFFIINETTRLPVSNPVAKVIEQGGVVGLANHTVLKAKDGREWPIADSAAPIHDSGGALIGIVLVFREVSAQRSAEIAARRLAAIVESSEDAIIGKDLRGIVTSWNTGAEHIFGYTAEEMIGQSITRLFPAERIHEEQIILSRLQAGERVEHFETVRISKSGQLLDVSLSVSPIRDSDGLIVGASKIARDISQKKRAERALQAAQAKVEAHAQELEDRVQERTGELRRALAELESFSYSISHDLRAPLRAMQQYSQALLQDYGSRIDEEGRRYLNRIVSSADRLDVLIRDVLTYSHVLRSPLAVKRVDLGAVVAAAIQSYPSLQLPNASINILSPLHPVRAHEAFLFQCVSNLLSNAVKFVSTSTTPEVRLWTELHGSKVRLFVRDNGIGIPVEDHSRIFRMFERAHEAYEGTGIGLTIVRKAAERMGGQVGLESRPGIGSTFWIELPAADGGA